MKNFTARGLRYSTQLINLDDMWYTPCPSIVRKITYRESAASKKIVKEIKEKHGPLHKIHSIQLVDILKHRYKRCVWNNEDVSWLKSFDRRTQREILYWHVVVSENNDQWKIVPYIPFNNFGYVLMEDGIISNADKVFNISRLVGIRQLAALHNPISRERNPNTIAMTFPHNRLTHSLDVCALMGLVIKNNEKQLIEHKNLLRVAAATHDWRTPAFGDTTKWIDPKTFDEDANYNEAFKHPYWQSFSSRYGIQEDLLYKTVNGEGLFGKLLDYADKIAYTSRDLYGYVNELRIRNLGDEGDFSKGFYEILRCVEQSPFVCNVWETLRVRDGQVFSLDKERLADFLHVRALMFKNLYFNPVSRFPEYVISQFVLKNMYAKGIITAEELLSTTDQLLEGKISAYVQMPFFTEMVLTFLSVQIESFDTFDEAERQVRQITTNPDYIAVIDPFQPKTKTGLDGFIVMDKGKLKTVREACPQKSELIEEIMTFDKKFRVYSFNITNEGEEGKKRFHELVS